MTKNAITDYSVTAANNTDLEGTGITGSNFPSNFDNALRIIASHLAKMNAGTSPLADTFCVADPVDLTKKVRIDAGNVTTATTRVLTMPDADVTISSFAATVLDDASATAAQATLGVREVLTANRTYYVDGTSGSDTNDGLSSGAGAFATVQKAATTAGGIDAATYNVTISVAAGTYSENVTLPFMIGSGTFYLTGAGSGSVTIQSLTLGKRSSWTISAFTLQGGTTLLKYDDFSSAVISTDIVFGTGATDQIYSGKLASCQVSANYSITGGAARHWRIENGSILNAFGRTVTITGTPAFTSYFAYVLAGANVNAASMTFTGSATGNRYYVATNSNLNTNGGGATYLPGNAAGTDAASSAGGYT